MYLHKSKLIHRAAGLLLILGLILPFMVEGAQGARSNAPEVIPSAFFDPYSVSWASVRNMTSAQFSQYFDEMNRKGFFVLDIEVDEVDGVERVSAVWQKNVDGRAWAEYRNMTDQEFNAKWTELRDLGYRPIDQECYKLEGRDLYAGTWIYNSEGLAWASYRNATDQEFSNLFDRYSTDGYMMVDFDPCPYLNELRYAAVWVKNSENLDWIELRDMTSAEFAAKFDEYKDKYWIKDIESYEWGGTQYYGAIWVENTSGRGWYEYRDMSSKGFGDRWLELRDAGYRLYNFEQYPTADGWRYAGVWRQNGDRPIWEHKDVVNGMVELFANYFDLPGVGIAVAYQGKFVYLRGVGYADVDDEIIAHSGTVFRIASISKAVAGVLSLRLEEEMMLDPAADTRDYVPSMPAHHTHSVEQTITNRSGIGHYEAYTTPAGHYNTALDAAKQLWDVPLVYTPGTDYLYSTHAYTFLGAAIEGATGSPVETVYEDYLHTSFNLHSIMPEDRTIANPFRSALYNTGNEEVEADDLSWKRLGGGFEASALDLARFGVLVDNGTILEPGSLTTLWTAADNLANYGYGWDVGTGVVGKAGAQLGARGYLRIYPDDDLVIAVLTNRKGGGHDPRLLCIAIANQILNNSLLFSQTPGSRSQIDEIEEPLMEAMDPTLVLYPVDDPTAVPSPEDLVEDDDVPLYPRIYIPYVDK
jgi:CubicO group peptidase (beta-lactamase class C family)